jgi:hypothetical protein
LQGTVGGHPGERVVMSLTAKPAASMEASASSVLASAC